MRIKKTLVPQAAIEASTSAMVEGFKAAQIQNAISAALRTDSSFHYPYGKSPNSDDIYDMRVADSLIQSARRAGKIRFKKGVWTIVA